MSRALILQHVPFEGPGRIIPVFRDFGIAEIFLQLRVSQFKRGFAGESRIKFFEINLVVPERSEQGVKAVLRELTL